MEELSDMNGEAWHLDKKVPIGLAIMIVVQTITLVYVGTSWKDGIDNRISYLEKGDARNSAQETRIIILEQKFAFISESLGRIEKKLDGKP